MNLKEQQLRLMETLLRGISQDAQDPEAWKLFFGVFWKDMAGAPGGRTGRGWEGQVYFSCVLCRNDEVVAAAAPCLFLNESEKMPLRPRHLRALRKAGVPLFSDFLTKEYEEDGTPVMRLNARDCPPPSGWRFPTVFVPSELTALVCKKGMAAENRVSGVRPTSYGNQLGLCAARWYGKAPAEHPQRGLYCSAAGWVNRVRLGAHPWGDGPDWEILPLDTRLERMRANRAGNPGHCMSGFLRLEAMPLEPLLVERLNKKYLKKNLPALQALYSPGITYGQAARNADRLLRSDSESERERGLSSLRDLAALFGYEDRQSLFRPQTQGEDEELRAIHEDQPDGPDGQSLSDRLARAGISECGTSRLPLAGDCLADVFQGLSRLIGTSAPAQAFYRGMPPEFWERPDEPWNGTLAGVLQRLAKPEWEEKLEDTAFQAGKMPPSWHLVAEPFCLLEEIRSLEKAHSALLEELRQHSEMLKKELERMNFDGDAC